MEGCLLGGREGGGPERRGKSYSRSARCSGNLQWWSGNPVMALISLYIFPLDGAWGLLRLC